jgi:hypothetical protein
MGHNIGQHSRVNSRHHFSTRVSGRHGG